MFLTPRRSYPLSLLLAGLLLSAPAAWPQTVRLPDLGSSAETVMTAGAEARLGQTFMRSVRKAVTVMDDPFLTHYLETLGQTLGRASADTPGRLTFFLVDDPTINAFAGPGGYIGVHSGLILAAETESELAAVLAHEIAHVSQRHLLRAFEEQRKLGLPTLGLLLAAAVLGTQVSGDLGAAAITGIQAGVIQRQINFTRENEREADRIGIASLASAGHDPYAMPGFFERLSRATRVYENQAPAFLRTHPVNSDRIAEALARAGAFGARQRPDGLEFQLTRAALRERGYPRAEQAAAEFSAALRAGRHRSEIAERYGYALALERARQFDPARAETGRLLAAQPSQPEFIALEARLDLRQGQTERAVRNLRQAVALAPAHWPLRLALAEALLQSGQASRAVNELEAVARLRPEDPGLHQRLVDAATQAGNRVAIWRFRAEQHYAAGDLKAAIDQLEIALRQRDLPYHEAARIQARLERLREEAREQRERGGRDRP